MMTKKGHEMLMKILERKTDITVKIKTGKRSYKQEEKLDYNLIG